MKCPSPTSTPPVIRIVNGTFYRHNPASNVAHPNPSLFTSLTFQLPSSLPPTQHWCIVGPSLSGKTSFLQVLRGQHLCIPPSARVFPYLSTDSVPSHRNTSSQAIRYVGFGSDDGLGASTTTTYLAARYESRREATDFTLRDFLLGHTELNPLETRSDPTVPHPSTRLVDHVVQSLSLTHLLERPVAFLSNGQGRRARIGRALLTSPEVLLLDEPFMGLDPHTVAVLSPRLHSLASKAEPRLVLSLRPQDVLPGWITHVVYLKGDCTVGVMGPREEVLGKAKSHLAVDGDQRWAVKDDAPSGVPPLPPVNMTSSEPREAIVEMDKCQVKYGGKISMGNWTNPDSEGSRGLNWTVRRGDRWGVFGPNGSGKTTVVSLLCSDHPQAYALPIKMFGRGRLPEPGRKTMTYWDIQSRVGHSSPEVHQHMPRSLPVWNVVASAWADTFSGVPKLGQGDMEKIKAIMKWFEPELNPEYNQGPSDEDTGVAFWGNRYLFGELGLSAQRVALFARAVVKSPDIVVLDEAFSGMDQWVRDKCLLFLEHGQMRVLGKSGEQMESCNVGIEGVMLRGLGPQQALICISHVREEVPDSVRQWLYIPESQSGQPARYGGVEVGRSIRTSEAEWRAVWDM